MKKIGRLSKQEIQKRVLSLETLYGQKSLSQRLGVSTDTIRRYRDGKSTPQTKNIYQKLNNLYNKNKSLIQSDAIEIKKKQIETRKTRAKTARVKERYAAIYPDYTHNSPASTFIGVRNFERLEDLSEAGYVAAWRGGTSIPLEVQFLIHGESLSRWGQVINIVGVISLDMYGGTQATLEVYPIYHLLIPGLSKNDTFEQRIDKLRYYFHERLKIDKGVPLAFLGFYFKEGDEI